jgi:biotin carboxylase
MEEAMPMEFGPGTKELGSCLVLATGSRLQYRALRCAADYFHAVYVLGTSEARPLSMSHACSGFFDAQSTKDRFHEIRSSTLNEICTVKQIGYIIPSDAITTRYLATVKDHVNARCFPVPTAEVFDVLDNKFLFSQLCQKLALPHPITLLAEDEAAILELARLRQIASPSVAKPLSMYGSLGVTKLVWNKPEELAGRTKYAPILIQNYIDGVDVSAFFLCHKGEEIASVLYRKDDQEVSFLDIPHILEACRKVNRHFRYDGVLGFDIRISPDGSFYFLECNPRFWYNMHVAQIAGLNFVALGFQGSVPTGPALGIKDTSVTNLGPLLRKLLTPWRLRGEDRRMLRYFAGDILPHAWMLRQRMGKEGRMARGQRL